MLDENRKGSENEIKQIEVLCQQMVNKLADIRDQLINNLKKESLEREERLRKQLEILTHLVPTTQLYLLISSIFCSSTGKMDFLDMGYTLNNRIQSFLSSNECSQPTFPTQVHTNYRADFARALEPFLGMKSVILPSMLHRRLSVPPDTPGSQSPGDVDLLVSPFGFMSNTPTCKSYK
uniref:Uncharacterized protein n=1 Tax=Romanomermis culicivorax TaxID=13658 RepID=A0A915I1T3_ROMCU